MFETLTNNLSKTMDYIFNLKFQGWTNSGVNNQGYQADKDLIICVKISCGDNGGSIIAYTGVSSADTIIARAGHQWNIYDLAVTFPVKKGNWWKVSCSHTPTVNFMSYGN